MILGVSGCSFRDSNKLPPPIDVTYNYVKCGKKKEKIDLMEEPKNADLSTIRLIYTHNMIEMSDALSRAESIVDCYEAQTKGNSFLLP